MDLAKIRKKSLQAVVEPSGVRIQAPLPVSVQMQSTLHTVLATPVSAATDVGLVEPLSEPVATAKTTESLAHFAVPRSPLEVILAGRTAAGCDDESILAEDATSEIVVEARLEFLCFRVSDEIYGINIMD